LDVKEDIRTEGAILAGSATIEGGLVARQRMQVEGGYRYNPMKNHMYPPTLLGDDSPLVYQDIFDAKEAGVIGKLGDPAYDDTTHNNQDNAYHGRRAICYGTGDNNIADFTGARVNVPAGYDTLWVRVLSAQEDTSPQWTRFQACSLTAEGLKDQDYGIWVGGGRFNNRYCPDGSLADGGARYHEWLGIPVEPGKDVALLEHPGDEDGLWFSGLAFSKNPWHHTTQAANVYKNAYNGGEEITWVDQSWNHDILAKIPSGKTTTISVPVLPSGTDKLIYLIERNDNSNGAMHAGITITVEGEERKIERFSAGYQNPFARHWNSKWYQRYMAARIPKEFIPSDKRYIDVTIDMGYQTDPIYLREIGTHDLETPFLE
ncbi:MAG: hypothetical protein KJO08_06925, partial [Gammaproteobacteria bacterium]|nr:hypothetical protein [Gammaproteobacteria bacterium]NNJ84480.1 hypothetical protein [Gammaproteobacteria bacterium]